MEETAIARHRLTFLANFLGLTEEEGQRLSDILTQETPKGDILERPIRGGSTAKYVPGHKFIERFNDAFGFLWSFEVPEVVQQDGHIIAHGRWSLQVPGRTITRSHPDGTKEEVRFDGFSIVKEQFGSAEVKKWAKDNSSRGIKKGDPMDPGNDFKAAATDAMKKCGTELGMFMDIYGSREAGDETKPQEGQVTAFYRRAEQVGMSKEEAEKWASERLEKPFGELEQQELLGLVADLIDMGRKKAE